MGWGMKPLCEWWTLPWLGNQQLSAAEQSLRSGLDYLAWGLVAGMWFMQTTHLNCTCQSWQVTGSSFPNLFPAFLSPESVSWLGQKALQRKDIYSYLLTFARYIFFWWNMTRPFSLRSVRWEILLAESLLDQGKTGCCAMMNSVRGQAVERCLVCGSSADGCAEWILLIAIALMLVWWVGTGLLALWGWGEKKWAPCVSGEWGESTGIVQPLAGPAVWSTGNTKVAGAEGQHVLASSREGITDVITHCK